MAPLSRARVYAAVNAKLDIIKTETSEKMREGRYNCFAVDGCFSSPEKKGRC